MIELNKLSNSENVPVLLLFFIIILALYKARGIYAVEDPEEQRLNWIYFFIIFGVGLLAWAICSYMWNYNSLLNAK